MENLTQRLADLQCRLSPQHGQFGGQPWEWLDTRGEGQAILMLPGSAADAFMFVNPLHELGDRFRIISVSPPPLFDPDSLADGMAAVCNHLELPPALVVGSSLGAWWGPFFAHRHPARVAGLLIGNGFVDADDLASNPLFERAGIEDVAAEALHAQWRGRMDAAPASPMRDLQLFMLDRKSPQALKAHFQAVVRARACPPLSLDGHRMLVLGCEDDPVIAPAARERVRRHFRQARSATLPAGGHYPHLLSWPAYRQELLSLLDGVRT